MKNIYNGIMGLVVGDAVGAPVEFMARDRFHLSGMVGYGSHNLPPGSWTDDSAMALATVESIARLGKVDVNDIMHNFSLWFTQAEFTPYGRTFGVGNTVMQALHKYLEGTPAMECGCPNVWDNGNGALMRILPLAYTDCDEATIDAVSGLTHAHYISKVACRIYIEIARGLLQGYELRELLHKYEVFPLEWAEFQRIPMLESCTRDQIESSGYVLDTLEAALWSLLHSSNYRDCILLAANLGGDADTTCAVAGGLAGIMYGVGSKDGIPEEWIAAIARRDWITELCDTFDKTMYDQLPVLTPEEQERIKFLEDIGIYEEHELDILRKGLIKNIRIEDNKEAGGKNICYCFDDGGVYRNIYVDPGKKNGEYTDAYYLGEDFMSTSSEKARWLDIHEMRYGEIIKDALMILDGGNENTDNSNGKKSNKSNYDAKKWMKKDW